MICRAEMYETLPKILDRMQAMRLTILS